MKSKLDRIRDEHRDNVPPVPYLPIGEVILVYRLPSEEKTAGGLYVPEEHRWSLLTLYGVFVLAVATLYPACKWYAKAKAEKRHPWMKYI